MWLTAYLCHVSHDTAHFISVQKNQYSDFETCNVFLHALLIADRTHITSLSGSDRQVNDITFQTYGNELCSFRCETLNDLE